MCRAPLLQGGGAEPSSIRLRLLSLSERKAMLLAQMELQPEDLEADAGEGELASEMAAPSSAVGDDLPFEVDVPVMAF